MNQQSNKRPLAVAIMGPTASGKTAAALAIAQQVPCEIISVDSALVYRGMDIGTAKPSKEELAAVPHHLIDIIDPLESYSVAQFRTVTPSPNAFPTASDALLSSRPFGHQTYTTPGPRARASGFQCCAVSGFTSFMPSGSVTNAAKSLV